MKYQSFHHDMEITSVFSGKIQNISNRVSYSVEHLTSVSFSLDEKKIDISFLFLSFAKVLLYYSVHTRPVLRECIARMTDICISSCTIIARILNGIRTPITY